MGVKLKERENTDGTITPYLVINHDGIRKYEFLPTLKYTAGRTPADRQKRKENKALADKIFRAKCLEVEADEYGIQTEEAKKVIVLDWMRAYAKTYAKADVRMINAVIGKFEKFLVKQKQSKLLMKELKTPIVEKFKEKLQEESEGEGGRSYFNRFRKIIRQAYKDKLLIKNPCEGVDPPAGSAKIKDILTSKELQLLANTETEAPEVKRAFIFCSITGLRFVDVKGLVWEKINLKNSTMTFVQSKTKKKKVQPLIIPLNKTALALLGAEKGKKELVFNLPSANGCNKSLNALVKRAKIEDKHITWHSARHGFGTNLIFNKVDVHTASKLLGHSSLAHTQRYIHASDELNKKAVDSLPDIELNRIVEHGDTFSISEIES